MCQKSWKNQGISLFKKYNQQKTQMTVFQEYKSNDNNERNAYADFT